MLYFCNLGYKNILSYSCLGFRRSTKSTPQSFKTLKAEDTLILKVLFPEKLICHVENCLWLFILKDKFYFYLIHRIRYYRLPWWLRRWRICPAVWETGVQSLGQEDPLEKGMATHSSLLAWKIPWIEEPGGYGSWGWRVRNHWAANTFTFSTTKWRKLKD